mgnify:CR=1 FL=1
MALSTPSNISIMDIHGIPAPGTAIEFKPVITYSEYQYYPSPVWTGDAHSLAVFIPAADPLAEPRQPGAIWTMDTRGGNPILRRQVTPQFIGPVTIQPDLGNFFYVIETGQPEDNKRDLRTGSLQSLSPIHLTGIRTIRSSRTNLRMMGRCWSLIWLLDWDR